MRSSNNQDVERVGTGEIDLSRILRSLSKKRWRVIVPTLAAMLAASAYVNAVKPRYSAESRVLLENQENFLTRVDKGEKVDTTAPDAEAVQSQIQLLTSRDLARRVVNALSMRGNVEFDPLANGVGTTTRALILLGLARDPMLLSPEDRILETFAERLAVLSPTKTRVLSIEFSSRDPDLAAKGANAVADAYIEMQAEAKRLNAHSAAQSLGALVEELKSSAAEADARAEEFRLKSGLLVGNNNTTISAQQLGDLNNQLSLSRTQQADAQAKAKLLRDMLRENRIADIPDVANNEHIRRLAEQRVTLRAQLALELRTLMSGHPRIKELQAQLSDLDQAGRAAAVRAVRALENDARIAGARVENLTHALEEQKKVAGVAGADEVHLRELERSAKLLKEHLEVESAKYQEALARERVRATPADARVIQRALAPQQPSFPKKLPITLFATLAGVFLSAGAVIAGELLSGRAAVVPSTMRKPEEAHDPIVAPEKAPSIETSNAAPLARQQRSEAFYEDQRVKTAGLLSRINSARMFHTCVSVLAVDCEEPPRAFDSIVALSRALSRRGRTILVAAQSSEHRYDQLIAAQDRPRGLTDLISGEAAFTDIIHRDAHSRMHVLPAGEGEGEPQHDVSLVVEALTHTYDFVVFATFVQSQALELAPLFNIALVREIDPLQSLRIELAHAGCEVLDLDEAPADLAA